MGAGDQDFRRPGRLALQHKVGAEPKRFRVAIFNTSGESIAAVPGGHVELAIAATGVPDSHVQAGRLQVLAQQSGQLRAILAGLGRARQSFQGERIWALRKQ